MALLTYQQVQDSLKGWLWNREDLSGRIPDFLAMGESRLNKLLRVRQMETSASIALTSGSGSLPTDYLAYRRVITQDSPTRILAWADPDWAEDHYYAETGTSLACHFTIIGSTIKTYPSSGSNLTMSYYQKIPALESNQTGNWITQNHPELYIYSALVEAAHFLDDDERITTWGNLLQKAIDELKKSDSTARYAKAIIRPPGATP